MMARLKGDVTFFSPVLASASGGLMVHAASSLVTSVEAITSSRTEATLLSALQAQ